VNVIMSIAVIYIACKRVLEIEYQIPLPIGFFSLNIMPNSAASEPAMTPSTNLILLVLSPKTAAFSRAQMRFFPASREAHTAGSTVPQSGELSGDDVLVRDLALQDADVAGELVHAGDEFRRD
jgi:hypothetical protein